MTSLLIDIGNTHLKWGTDSKEGFVFGGECDSQPELIESLFAKPWARLKPEHLFVSCVGNETIRLQIFSFAKSTWRIQAESLVSPRQGCGITNAYARPERLGSDRWAAMVAAYEQTKGPVCVVDSGTAVTLDVVNGQGMHLGGLILPGYGLMQACLQKGTRLEFNTARTEAGPLVLGQSTGHCIQQGTAVAISSMVNAMFEKLTREMTGISLILTGGDADLLQNQLDHAATIEPYLILQGLAIIHRSSIVASQS